jgi:Domain of unknown function (DUF4476)
MKSIKSILTILFALFALAISAQNSAFGDNYRDDNNRNGSRRFARRNVEPFPMSSFNRDFVGLSNSHYAFIDKELRNYTRSHNLSSEQIRRLALLLPTDHEKYDYLTFSLAHVFDIGNFSVVSTAFVNRNAKDAFYRFLVREGVPAGDYNTADAYYAGTGRGGYGYNAPPPPYDRYGNAYDNNYNNNYGNSNRNNNDDGYYNNDAFNHSYGKEYQRDDKDRDRNNNNTYDNNRNDSNNGQSGINSNYRGSINYKDFEILKDNIKRNTFEKGKLEAAKSFTKENTLMAKQIAEIARLFDFENTRLDYAKFAYDYAYDRENYYAVASVMNMPNNRKELQKFIDGRKK